MFSRITAAPILHAVDVVFVAPAFVSWADPNL
ncbi:hypothetical protein J108_11500 [Mycobacteroides abscessus subsp. bolletii CRM-0020]|uniref:Uncharacterized protein n=1 Tax=Mycobacteroides abscessus subsp. bolletii CRM-0020 TaxID=1306401 RepID=A0A829HUZ8_9MYCO|nr:hypothetical protein MYCMA_08710 [Mycobacteroides abscessus subsp. massiliense str. GO 06]EHC01224.1 hypothetical protein MAB47J26_06915 [Mycobacteroides abscessus 47J26]EPQ23352.1 hypothetical protein J108_11500 [Mycobacteroides abscessus subsp. bolletii CRM-0020]SKS02009.1 Uncharacterised protein [Mycobacteroides abscessus subsp. abscessus]